MSVKIIDLFAGPGGLGEGFSSYAGGAQFELALSIEKDAYAHQTLRMRALFRVLQVREQLAPYYDLLNGESTLAQFYEHPWVQSAALVADAEAQCHELSEVNRPKTHELIRKALKDGEPWVLIGGPPCQAYSLVGRARNTNVTDFKDDERHFLYREYLNVLQEHEPAVFVMENVKGLLSSRNRDEGGMFEKIREDLSGASRTGYEIRSVVTDLTADELVPQDFIVRSERYGVPQARHRVILLGVRKDLSVPEKWALLRPHDRTVTAAEALTGLPEVRSHVSRGDTLGRWQSAIAAASDIIVRSGYFSEIDGAEDRIREWSTKARKLTSTGAEHTRISSEWSGPEILSTLHDPLLTHITGHQTRSHMESDLQRYFFAAAYNQLHGRSPHVTDFPEGLAPEHRNINGTDVPFKDRFRVVQQAEPSKTIVAHLAKDGHAFVHWDPGQVRSLTMREAARLQTFPDNYLFLGPQTARYTQVGNAVPPLLARQIAGVVAKILEAS